MFCYLVNVEGDVTGMTNSAGKLVISYTYDAWGRWIYYRHDAAWSDTLGGINPLLYRGYVYDHETQLYYLQSRYYDMNTHRFLNADVFTATGQGFIGNNMFTYCLNNPVLYMDVLGYFADYACLDEDPLDEESRINRSGGSASALDIFMRSLQCAADGLSMAAGNRSYLSTENHHVLSNKNSTYTPQFRVITDRYGMSLDSDENIVEMSGHRGRHTNAYHEFMLGSITELDRIADGDSYTFKTGFSMIVAFLQENPWLPYAR